jgi:non-ribosomal peptide synthase protein (TIGR01720 family)
MIPPSLHFEKPNPEIDFANSPFYVNTKLSEWRSDSTARRAGVSSFGIGGTNAHVIVEEAPPISPSAEVAPCHLLILSAKTKSALERATENLVSHLKRHRDVNVADVAYTLQLGRQGFSHRRMVVCRDSDDAIGALETMDPKRVVTGVHESGDVSVVFMFPGQGSQDVGMGLALYQVESNFRKEVDSCAEILKPHLGFDVRTVLYPSAGPTEEVSQRLNQTDITQPALFVIEYALAKLWMEWGMQPQAMIGHSIGEYVAACLAGVFSLHDALGLVAERGRMMNELPAGTMVAVPLGEKDIQPYLGDALSLAAINGPSLCVVSGPTEAMTALQQRLSELGLECRRLRTSHAFHSKMMDPIIGRFTERVKAINLSSPKIPYLSNLSGTWITKEQATDPGYWGGHLRHTVRFSEGLQELLKGAQRCLLEVGPGQALSSLAKQHPDKTAKHVILSSIRSPRDRQLDLASVLDILGRLWLTGVRVNWQGFYLKERRRRISLPTYPFERQRYWIEPEKKAPAGDPHRLSLRKKPDIAEWFYTPSWKRSALPQLPQQPNLHDGSCWLVFTDACGLGSQLAKRLEAKGHDVITVMTGEGFSRFNGNAYAIDPQRCEDYIALLADLRELGRMPKKILHLWTVTSGEPSNSEVEIVGGYQALGFYSLLFLAQALGNQHMWDPLQIVIVTNNAQEVTGDERLCPEKAMVSGPCKVIPQEYSNITCRSIDIALAAPGSCEERALIDQVMVELTAETSDTVVAFRGKHRWVQIFEQVKLGEPIAGATRLRERGVYLITGGLGGIGLAVAGYLARSVGAKLILTGRSAFPKKEEWARWSAGYANGHMDDDETRLIKDKIKKLQALEELGAEIEIASADVTDIDKMQVVIRRACERFGAIHGVFHAAGILNDGIIQLKEPQAAASVLSPKVKGTLVLEALFKDMELDFLVLFSSLRSILGGRGVADYCAANAFLDAYAHQVTRNGMRVVSVNWGVWREDGMSVKGVAGGLPQREHAATEPLTLEDGMWSKEGTEALHRILATALPQVAVSSQDFHAIMQHYHAIATSGKSASDASDPPAQRYHLRSETAPPYVAPGNPIEQIIARIWQDLLGIDEVSIHDNFFELGGDSVVGLQFISRAYQAGLRLTSRQVFEHQTIAQLATVADTSHVSQAEQGMVAGSVPLTPIQHWFFEQQLPDPDHWNMALLLEVRAPLIASLLEKAMQQLMAHHDALRLRFVEEPTGWRQSYGNFNETSLISRVDLSALPMAKQGAAMEAAAAQLQASLKLSEGPLLRIALFDFGAHEPSRMLIVCHHLVIDITSWRILLEDLQTIYQALSRGQAIRLPPKTHSFKDWAERIAEFARSAAMKRELDYWLALRSSQSAPLPVDYPGGSNTVASTYTLSVSLDADETQTLLQDVTWTANALVSDVLLAALALAFARWTGRQSFLIELEDDGREVSLEGVDVSRTAGWFTILFPVLLELNEISAPWDALKSIKEQLGRVPNHGIGFGLLRYMLGDATIANQLRTRPEAEVAFLYMGQFDQTLPASLFGLARESSGPGRSLHGSRRHFFEITAGVTAGVLQLHWIFSENLHRRSTVEHLAQAVVEFLRSFITQVKSTGKVVYGPSDFPGAQLTQKELDEFLASLSRSK